MIKIWRAFLTTAGTKQFFLIFSPWVKWLSLTAFGLLVVGSIWGLAFAPPDYLQGNSYRIIFVHVPSASLAMSIYLLIAILSVIFLVWKVKTASLLAQALSTIGFMFCLLSLVTGSIWAKPTWGTYWVWDARLTSMLILAFLYLGIISLFKAFEYSPNNGKASAILSIIGAVNLPIIKYSVEWWNTLHQGSTFTLSSSPKMPSEMWIPLLLMTIGSYLLTAALSLYRTNTLILRHDQHKIWVTNYLNQIK